MRTNSIIETEDIIKQQMTGDAEGKPMPSAPAIRSFLVSEWMDIEELRYYLGGGSGRRVSKSTVNNLRKAGVIPAHKLGKGRAALVRFKKSEIDDALIAYGKQRV